MSPPSNQTLAAAIVAATGNAMKCIEAIGVACKHDDAKDILDRAMQMAVTNGDQVLINRLKKSFKHARKPAASTAVAKRASKPIDGKAHVVKAEDLPSLGAAITFHQQEIDEIGRKALRAALPLKLKQGLACLKARALLALSPEERARLGGKAKAASPESGKAEGKDSEFFGSFDDWLLFQPISSGSAYDYLRAVEGLGLDHKATEKQLLTAYTAAVKKAGGDLSITKLKGLAVKPEESDPAGQKPDPNTPEAKAGEARVFVQDFIKRWDGGVKAALLEHADKAALQQLDEFLSNTREHVRKRLKGTK